MKRICIAGSCDDAQVSMRASYLKAVRTVGAVPSISYASTEAEADALAEAFDALLMPGGGDLPASHFGQEPHVACSYDDKARDVSDRLLFDAFSKAGKRILGICRGCQVANVFLGGTLHQHLPDVYSPVLWHSGNITGRHAARVEPGTLLASLLGEGDTKINSSHHQAIDALGKGLVASAYAPDGVLEAAEGDNLLLLQWHPEWMGEPMRPVFEWLVG